MHMEKDLKSLFAARVKDFHMPRYNELPDVGLYLEQVTKYINGILIQLGFTEITPSMVSNYVKKGVIPPPVKKQYYVDQIGYLLFVGIAKNVISIEEIVGLIKMQTETYDRKTAYNYFCSEFENMLHYICGLKNSVDKIGVTNTEEKMMFRSVIISASHIIFIRNCFNALKEE